MRVMKYSKTSEPVQKGNLATPQPHSRIQENHEGKSEKILSVNSINIRNGITCMKMKKVAAS